MREQSLPSLRGGAAALGLKISGEQVAAFSLLADELLAWNERVNLTSITEPGDIQVNHFLDSLTALPILRARMGDSRAKLVDVGAGAGLPGLALALVEPSLDVTLVEATAKKVSFMEHAIRRLSLPNACALHGRAEELAHREGCRQAFDFAIARAVASTAVLVELLTPFLRVGGWAIVMKKREAVASEVEDAATALDKLRSVVEEVVHPGVPGLLQDRALVVIRKEGNTPAGFPRRSAAVWRRRLRAAP